MSQTTTTEVKFKDAPARMATAAVPHPGPLPGGEGEELGDVVGEKMVLNMGPSNPATHGVLRIILELDGGDYHEGDSGCGIFASGG